MSNRPRLAEDASAVAPLKSILCVGANPLPSHRLSPKKRSGIIIPRGKVPDVAAILASVKPPTSVVVRAYAPARDRPPAPWVAPLPQSAAAAPGSRRREPLAVCLASLPGSGPGASHGLQTGQPADGLVRKASRGYAPNA